MRLLLDTHVVIWWDSGAELSAAAHHAITTADEVYVSAASAWEIAIKASLGKIARTRSLQTVAADSGFLELPVLIVHTEVLAGLPPLHRDPFDRLLVAQALTERLTLVTRDPLVGQYAVPVIGA